MGKFDSYKLPLKNLGLGTHKFEYPLDDTFFTRIDEEDIRHGKLNATVTVTYNGGDYVIKVNINGVILIACDRCLDSMEHIVEADEKIVVKLGNKYTEESDELIIIPESEGEINLAWFFYEFIALTIPLKHVHPAGKCNKGMSAKLNKHKATIADDEEMEDDFAMDDMVIADDDSDTDPRWNELKKLKDNN